jgi:poly(A) polymerase
VNPKTYHATAHDIDHTQIDSDAIEVIEKLRNAGFAAYLVGGGVRDLLIKKTPKDFDISTSAKPEEIKRIFRKQCVLIGKRFRLAHVRFGHKIFEVATFRAGENDSNLIVQDNIWGTEEEDVTRRDFTINGLMYDPFTHTVIDYIGGWEDIHKGLLRTIGDAAVRFKQDPVRMLRLLKFRARFGFNLHAEAKQALFQCRDEIIKSSPARILEEIFRMLESGAAAPFFSLMKEAGFLKLLFSSLSNLFDGPIGKDIFLLLAAADKIHQKRLKRPLDRSILAACLIYPIVAAKLNDEYTSKGLTPHLGDIIMVVGDAVKENLCTAFHHIPRRITATATFILTTQYRLTPLSGKRHHRPKIVHHKEFNLALDFLKIRRMSDPTLADALDSWLTHHRERQPPKHRERSQENPERTIDAPLDVPSHS